MQLLTTLLVFSLCLFPNLATAASPHIYDAPQAGPPGSQTTTVGNGWDPNATLDIYFDSTDVGLVDTDSNGSFGMTLQAPTIRQNGLTIQIPKDAVPGQHWITAVERITQLQAQVPFTVRADWPQFHLDPLTRALTLMRTFESRNSRKSDTQWKYKTGDSYALASGGQRRGRIRLPGQFLYALDARTRACCGSIAWVGRRVTLRRRWPTE